MPYPYMWSRVNYTMYMYMHTPSNECLYVVLCVHVMHAKCVYLSMAIANLFFHGDCYQYVDLW